VAGKKEISLAELGFALSNRFRANPDLPVYISGDRDTLHGDMVKVYETVRATGIQKVAFIQKVGLTAGKARQHHENPHAHPGKKVAAGNHPAD
jgi:hypothetical protein